MEALMEKIRGRADNMRSLTDTCKIIRMGMADRRHSLDIQDKAVLRSCLDSLQSSISVRSVTGMSDRLETIARQMSLKFMVHSTNPSQHNFYISTETFYVEICMDQTGAVLETRIHHQNPGGSSMNSQHNTQSAPEISDCLSKGDFSTFCDHLKGLMAVYDMPDCGPVDKSRAWQALYTLEHDLNLIASTQAWVTDLNHLIHKTGLGMVHNRAGGIPMKLRFFMPPYELLDTEQQTLLPMNETTVVSKNRGLVARVTLQSSPTPYLLPLTSLISNGEHLPINQTNSIPLPAHFTLCLDQAMPLSAALAKILVSITSIDWLDSSLNTPLLSLITKQASNGLLDPSNNRGLFVTLPDQQHCYFLTETQDLVGQAVEKIPFRHPGQVSAIIDVLRRQALFNTLISSCVRTNSLEDVDTSVMFEVTCLDATCQTLSVTFEHPVEETMATAELKLNDLTSPRCRVYTSSNAVCSEETANTVMQRSLSIPVTMRAVISRGKGQVRNNTDDNSEVGVGVGGPHNGITGHQGTGNSETTDFKHGGSGGGRFKMETGRSPGLVPGTLGTPAVCDPGGGPGGGRATRLIKGEPMEVEGIGASNNSAESLNRDGPQGVHLSPGAPTLTSKGRLGLEPESRFRHPSGVMPAERQAHTRASSENRLGKTSDFKPDNRPDEETSSLKLNLTSTRGPLADNQNKPRKEKSSTETGGGGHPIRPNVSITPISDSSLVVPSPMLDTQGATIKRPLTSTGIEIIPLGGGKTVTKSKVRDLKRSLSEDDKRRVQKKEKKRRDEKQRQSLTAEHRPTNPLGGKDKGTKGSLAGVIERLSFQSGDSLGLEIKPAVAMTGQKGGSVEPHVEITLDRVSKTRSSEVKQDIKPKLKLSIKTPGGKHAESNLKEKKDDKDGFSTTNNTTTKLDTTFQIPKLLKPDTKERPSPNLKTPLLKAPYTKITERFITDPSQAIISPKTRMEERKVSLEKTVGTTTAGVQLHIVKSSHTSPLGLGDGRLEDKTALTLIKWMASLKLVLELPVSGRSSFSRLASL